MLRAHAIQREAAEYNRLPAFDKFANFWLLRKRRVAYVVILGLLYHYDIFNRSRAWIAQKRANVKAKYERRWMLKYNAENVPIATIGHFKQSAYGMKHLNKSDVDSLAKLMFEVENQLKHGFSRELVAKVLMSDGFRLKHGRARPAPEEAKGEETKQKTEMEKRLMVVEPLMDKESRIDFMVQSGFRSKGKQIASSLNVRDFASFMDKLMDRKVGPQHKDEFIDDFIAGCWREINELKFEDLLLESIYNYENPDEALKKKKLAEKAAAEEAEKKAEEKE